MSEDVADAINHGLEEASEGLVKDLGDGGKSPTGLLMERRVANFEAGRKAIADMKASLVHLINSLDNSTHSAPIVIVIDELDRCRPTYAVKVLEEIKHLFDVPGIVFILAMHSEQLGHSVSGAYGAGFDGQSYLRRFIDRQYRLAEANLSPLLSQLCTQSGLDDTKFAYPRIAKRGGLPEEIMLPDLIGKYMKLFALKARDAFELIDMLQTSVALAQGKQLYLAYLLPLIAGQMKGQRPGQLPSHEILADWVFIQAHDHFGRDTYEVTVQAAAEDFLAAAKFTREELTQAVSVPHPTPAAQAVQQFHAWNGGQLPPWAIENYPQLVATVSRFSQPKFEASLNR